MELRKAIQQVMGAHDSTLYPMLAVGAFVSMFLAGIVLAHELGLSCIALLGVGLLSACLASILVCELERRDRAGFDDAPRRLHSPPSRAPRDAAPVGARPCHPAAPRGRLAETR